MITLKNVHETLDLACNSAKTEDEKDAVRATARYLDDMTGGMPYFERRVDETLLDIEKAKAESEAMLPAIWEQSKQEEVPR